MGRPEIFGITIYTSVILSGWINNGKVMEGLENIYNKKLYYEHYH